MTGRARGFSILEVAFASVVLTVGVLGLVSALATSVSLRAIAVEDEVVARAATVVMERIRGWPAATVHAHFTTAPYNRFSTDPLRTPTGGTLTGSIVMFADETAVPANLGGPRDLNGNNNGVANDDASTNFHVLPVEITVTWMSVGGGPRTKKFDFVLWGGS